MSLLQQWALTHKGHRGNFKGLNFAECSQCQAHVHEAVLNGQPALIQHGYGKPHTPIYEIKGA